MTQKLRDALGSPGWIDPGGLVVVAGFVLSRVLYSALLGLRFETGSLAEYMQFVDPQLLRKELWTSLFYLRDQPPGFNLFLGLTLQLAGRRTDAVFHAVFMLLGLIATLSSYGVVRQLVPLLRGDDRFYAAHRAEPPCGTG
jgi:hypothetical protein